MNISIETVKQEIMEHIRNGDRILLFNEFPLGQIPMMMKLRIERLNHKEMKLYESKAISVAPWETIRNWEGINKFIVVWLESWYLVRIYES